MKTVLITGAAGGIGHACAAELIRQGYRVIGMGRHAGQELMDEFAAGGGRFIIGDITSDADRHAVLAGALAFGEGLYALVNTAGIAPKVRADLLDMTQESYDLVMDINLRGMMFMTQLAAKQMISQPVTGGLRGAIVNISSLSAYAASVNRGEYCISKAGVTMLTRLYADRLAGENITVNEIRPGIIETGMTAAVHEKYTRLIEGGLLPIARWGQPQDVARAVAVLLDGTFGYTTGQSIDVDGGFHLRRL